LFANISLIRGVNASCNAIFALANAVSLTVLASAIACLHFCANELQLKLEFIFFVNYIILIIN